MTALLHFQYLTLLSSPHNWCTVTCTGRIQSKQCSRAGCVSYLLWFECLQFCIFTSIRNHAHYNKLLASACTRQIYCTCLFLVFSSLLVSYEASVRCWTIFKQVRTSAYSLTVITAMVSHKLIRVSWGGVSFCFLKWFLVVSKEWIIDAIESTCYKL